tara:strand:+ start:2306 stop:3046 length:741 start_codon:yes stop_codon:yes gene_type:complete
MMASSSLTKRSFGTIVVTTLAILYLACACNNHNVESDDPINIGDAHWENGEYDASISAYRLALHKDTLDHVVWGRLAKAYASQGNRSAANTYLRKSVAGFLKNGQRALDSGNDSLAFKYYQNLLEIDPSNSMAHVFIGQIYSRSGEDGSAIASYLRATKLDSFNYNTWVYLAAAYLKRRETLGAIGAYNKAISLNINSYRSYMGLGSIYLAQKEFSLAKSNFKTALSIKPDLGNAVSALEYISSLK